MGIGPGSAEARRIAVSRESGAELSFDWTVPVVLVAILVGLRYQVVPQRFPGWTAATAWAASLLATAAFFASVLLHELARAAAGRLFGLQLDRIRLFPFTSSVQFCARPQAPSIEMVAAGIGPVIHVVIAACFLDAVHGVAAAGSEATPVSVLAAWVGGINALLALVQLIPAFPLDAGRALRALLWALGHDPRHATRWAAAVGQIIAWVLMAFGIAIALGLEPPIVGDSRFYGLWMLGGGWLLNHAATVSYSEELVRDTLSHVSVSELMHDEPATVSRAMSISSFLENVLILPDKRTLPVVDNGNLLGFVRLEDVANVPQDEWARTPVGQIMVPLDGLPLLSASDDADLALQLLLRRRIEQLPVVERGRVLGFVHRWDIVHWLMSHDVSV